MCFITTTSDEDHLATKDTSIHRWWALGDIPIMCIRQVLSDERKETVKARSWIVEQLCITPKGSSKGNVCIRWSLLSFIQWVS